MLSFKKVSDIEKILLINSPYHCLFSKGTFIPPLGLCYIAAVLKESGFGVKVYDPNLYPGMFVNIIQPYRFMTRYMENLFNPKYHVWKKIREVIKKSSPDVVGISMTTPSYPSGVNVARIVKEISEDITVVAGGPHPTALFEEVAREPCINYVIRGEGEYALLELVNSLNHNGDLKKILGLSYKKKGKIIHNRDRPFIKHLDSLPFPAKDLLINRWSPRNMGGIMASRGCPYSCKFCFSTLVMWKKTYRTRSPKNVVDEIEYTIKKYGTGKIYFLDDLFTLNKRWVVKICRLIRERKLRVPWTCLTRADLISNILLKEMKLAGCESIGIGMESGNQEILNRMGKELDLKRLEEAANMIKANGIKLHCFVYLGYPGETKETIYDTKRLIDKLNPETIGVAIATPYPGIKLTETIKKMGVLFHDNWSEYTRFLPILKLSSIDSVALKRCYLELINLRNEKEKKLFRQKLFNFSYIAKKLREKFKSPRFFIEYLKEFRDYW